MPDDHEPPEPDDGIPQDPDLLFEQTFPDIPEEFHSVESGGKFEHCIECQLPLVDEIESHYSIAKVIQNGETIMEWAMCGDCVNRFREDISEESRTAMMQLLAGAKAGMEHMTSPVEVKTSYCFLCARPREELDGYSLQALCSGHELISFFMPVPFLVCNDCEMDAAESLSKATKEHFDRFYEENFPGPPASDIDLPKRRPMVI